MWTKIKSNMQAIILIIAFLGAVGGAQAYFAKSKDLDVVNESVAMLAASYSFDKDTARHNSVQERIWALEEQCKKSPCSNVVLNEIKKLKLELKALEIKLSKKKNG